MLSDIQSYIRATVSRQRDSVPVGPFLATFDRFSPSPYLSYALPEPDAAPDVADIEALIGVFAARDRTPRLEYLPGLAPRVEAALAGAGFREELRTIVMTVHPGEAVPHVQPAGIDIVMATADDDIADLLRVQYEAFAGDASPVGPADVERARHDTGLVILAREVASGHAVGAASATPVADGVTEICGVAVRQPYRGRGIAAALTWRLTELAGAAGADVPFVVPGGEDAARVYRQVGYQLAGQMLHLSRTQ